MAEDDEAQPTTSGLPDPSTRAWRHPSEMAGSIADPTALVTPTGSRFNSSLLSKGLFTAIVMLVATTVGIQLTTGGQTAPGDVAAPLGGANETGTNETGTDGAPDNDPGGGNPTASVLPDLTADRPDAFAETQPIVQRSLYTAADGETPVASAVLIGDVIITSASAVGTYGELWLEDDEPLQPLSVEVIGIDRFADLAVLANPDLPAGSLERDTDLGGGLAALVPFDVGDSQAVVVADGGVSGSLRNGAVIGLDEPIPHDSGHTFSSAIITSIPFEDHLAGAALTTPDGDLVGLVVNAIGAVVAALPVDEMIRLAQSILAEVGLDQQDFALDVATDVDGRAVVVDVDPNGPFADTLTAGDVLVAVNGVEVRSVDHLTNMTRRLTPGRSVAFTARRNEDPVDTTVVLDEPHLAVHPATEP